MIWGIHYFTTKLKTKIDVIPSGCFNKLYHGGVNDYPISDVEGELCLIVTDTPQNVLCQIVAKQRNIVPILEWLIYFSYQVIFQI